MIPNCRWCGRFIDWREFAAGTAQFIQYHAPGTVMELREGHEHMQCRVKTRTEEEGR